MRNTVLVITACALLPLVAWAHCDTMDGPVVTTARLALDKGDVTPVLKWVRTEDEPEMRAAFHQTLTVRTLSEEAKQLADRYFFETLVRVHRAGEGAPYDGLKPSGTQEPAVMAADRALETGTPEALLKMLEDAVHEGLHARFARAVAARQHAEETVDAGREFVKAYVEYVHFVEQLSHAAVGGSAHEIPPAVEHPHTH